MHFGGKLIDHEWSFINKEDLTVRKLYNLPQWNIVYDVGNGFVFQSLFFMTSDLSNDFQYEGHRLKCHHSLDRM